MLVTRIYNKHAKPLLSDLARARGFELTKSEKGGVYVNLLGKARRFEVLGNETVRVKPDVIKSVHINDITAIAADLSGKLAMQLRMMIEQAAELSAVKQPEPAYVYAQDNQRMGSRA